jgi:hypothetical protein
MPGKIDRKLISYGADINGENTDPTDRNDIRKKDGLTPPSGYRSKLARGDSLPKIAVRFSFAVVRHVS